MARWIALIAGGVLLAGAIVAAALLWPSEQETAPQPAPPRPKPEPTLENVRGIAARVDGDRVVLRARPGGRILARVGGRTEFGSPQTLAVAQKKGNWLAVRSSALRNGQLGWVDARAAELRLLRRPVTLEVDLSRRELTVVVPNSAVMAGRPTTVERRISVAIGATDTPTPPGEFYVTDKLSGADFGPYYGCCILALSGRQPDLPRGWSGGDRLAIHGSPTATWGQAVSNGCFHASEADLRFLMKAVPLGTSVVVHA